MFKRPYGTLPMGVLCTHNMCQTYTYYTTLNCNISKTLFVKSMIDFKPKLMWFIRPNSLYETEYEDARKSKIISLCKWELAHKMGKYKCTVCDDAGEHEKYTYFSPEM